MRSMGVYIHIPFCVQKCAYCDFLSAPAPGQRRKEYVTALKREMISEADRYDGYEVQTVFFGGGTPSLLEAKETAEILECLGKYYQIDPAAEITIEMNPGTVDRDKLLQWKKCGINRLSIGLQSAEDTELKLLGRIHTYEDFLQTYRQAREAGFANINIDLMSALPGQDMKSWMRTLEKVASLQPEHISAYSLIIEEGTRLYDRLAEYPPVPDEDEDRLMYQETRRILARKGYQRYEISNYAREGYACRHNCIYWQRGIRHTSDYAGFGLGATSMVDHVRWKNTDNMAQYLSAFARDSDIRPDQCAVHKKCAERNGQNAGRKWEKKNIKRELQILSQNDCMEEFMFLGLRMMCGVSRTEFADSFGVRMDDIYGGVLRKWEKQGMLIQSGDCVRLTDAGIDVSNVVLADFLL